jgi:16S rRNA (cytosine1402-N4)-methyltransferase
MHIPVLLNEVIEYLAPREGEVFVDGTLGNGGHALTISAHLGKTGRLLGIDQDPDSLARARVALADVPCAVSFVIGNFRHISELAEAEGIKSANGVLLDLGFSSDQIESSGRGFSFLLDEPLDMRMGNGAKFTAEEIVNEWEEANLADVIYGYGEETLSRQIAHGIVLARQNGRIKTTGRLVEIIRTSVPAAYTRLRRHFATKTFQALRIAVNDELGALKDGLAGAWALLGGGGRLATISFHGLEARVIKEFYRAKITAGEGEMRPKKAVKARREELLANPRSRSAQLRVLIKN